MEGTRSTKGLIKQLKKTKKGDPTAPDQPGMQVIDKFTVVLIAATMQPSKLRDSNE